MIHFLVLDKTQELKLAKKMKELSIAFSFSTETDAYFLEEIFVKGSPKAIVIEESIAKKQPQHVLQFLSLVAHMTPVFVLQENHSIQKTYSLIDKSLSIPKSDTNILVEELKKITSANDEKGQQDIYYFSYKEAIQFLDKIHGLAILRIDASSLKSFELEYGHETYEQTRQVLRKILLDLKGLPGSFRKSDIITEMADQKDQYIVLLQKSRSTGCLPHPGELEDIADRVRSMVQNHLYDEFERHGKSRNLPEFLRHVPEVIVGFSSILKNPTTDSRETIMKLMNRSFKSVGIQHARLKSRFRELMFSIIQSRDLLNAHYQAVFQMKNLTKEKIESVKKSNSIAPIADSIYGFESLIRVRLENAAKILDAKETQIVRAKYLKPNFLFEKAALTKTALELDQKCIRAAIEGSANLPAKIMINILPRNLYHLPTISQELFQRPDIILEISESENIDNLELFSQVQQQSSFHKIQFAIDDFGKAYTTFDRLLKIKPTLIKFDRSLVHNISNDLMKQDYLRGLISACQRLKTFTLAEGIEQIDDLMTLKEMGVDLIQGFLLHRPEEASKILSQLNSVETPALSLKASA